MSTKQYQWHKIANTKEELLFAKNNIAVTELKGKKICIGLHNSQLFAFAYNCPHAGGLLSDGQINERGHIICPIHGYAFNLQNGQNKSGEGYHLKQWPVSATEEGIFVGFEKNKSWLEGL